MPYLRDLYSVKKSAKGGSAYGRKKEARQTHPKKSKQKTFWPIAIIVLFIILAIANILYTGPALASYLTKTIVPISLFRDGKYLIIFQNNAELRSTGGFIGSYGVAQIKNLELENLDFNTNIYKMDNAYMRSNFVEAPERLKQFLKGKSWTLRDSNYDVSFPEAAEDISNFYEKESQDTIDGVVAINAKVIVDLLKLTGPVVVDETRVDAENFYDVTQFAVEKGYFLNPENWLVNEPKSFLKKLYPVVLEKAFKENKLGFIKLILRELREKQIMFYFKDPRLEKVAREKNWAGQVYSDEELKGFFQGDALVDYLYINANNYSGNKSSLSVKQKITYEVSNNKANLTLTRIHKGTNVWPDGPNNSYIRILVPEGSWLEGATLNGRNIFYKVKTLEEAGKTVFAIDVNISPGEAAVLNLSYSLAREINPYRIVIQKQSGTVDDVLEVKYFDKTIYNGLLDQDKFIQ